MNISILKQKISNLLDTATFRQSLITTTAVVVNGILGAVFYILVARHLGPANFGLFTIAIATTTLIADIADFGTNTGIVRFVPGYLRHDKADAFRLLKLSLELKAIVWVIILVSGFILASWLAKNFFNKPELIFPLQLSFLGVGGAMLFSYVQSSLQALEKYKLWSAINIFTNLLRLLLVLTLSLWGITTLNANLLIYMILPFFGFFLGLSLLPVRQILAASNETRMLKDFRSYNSYIGIFTVIAAVSARIDTYIAAKLLSAEQVGIYGAAVQLSSFIPQIMGGLGVVVAPKFSSFTSKSQMVSYLKKLQIMVSGLAGLFLLGSPIALYLIPFFYGQNYQALTGIFFIYLLGMLVYLISVPVHTAVFYYYARPQLFIYIAIGHLMLLFFAGTYLASEYGLVGLTLAVLAGMVFNFVIPLLYVLKRIRKDVK